METASPPRTWKVLLAFSIIYFVWGSTFLAIRVGVREVPPFLLAGMRFVVAGLAMYLWMRAKGTSSPSAREWRGASLLAVLFFVFDYGMVFWAETRVPSGMTAVMMAMIPMFMALSEILFLKTQEMTARLMVALMMGLAGVGVLVSRSAGFGDAAIDPVGATALLVATVSWSAASALTRKVPLPASKAMSSGAQMLAGGVLLTIAAGVLGEFHGFRLQAVSAKAWIALVYLIVAGSIVAFTAYVWLIHHESPTKVGTYAYVNPVVAVLLGYFFGGESLGPRTILGTLLVLASVVVITTGRKKTRAVSQALKSNNTPEMSTEKLSHDEVGG
ncbi:MAG TPA: EamA family transporter [Candidatus Sulfotelmatobacter sp.]|nr:EamA family transporter [Candidatus Sulfotelmatobacter sp.]